MSYDSYINYIKRLSPNAFNGISQPQLVEMLKDDYIRKNLALNLLNSNIIDSNVYNILVTKSLLNRYL